VADKVQSPCTKKCSVSESNICPSCFRTIEEITAWTYADEETRQKILARAKLRREGQKDAGRQ